MVENGEINTEAGVRMAQSALQAVAQEVESRIATARSADSLRTRVRILMPQEAEYHTVVGVGGAEPQQTRENAVGSYNALLRLCEQATGSNAGGEAERVNQGCQRFEEQVIGTDYMEDRRLNGLVRLRVQLEQQRHDLAAAETIRGPLKHLRRRFGVAVCERKIGKTIEGIEKVLKNNPIIQA
jgi:hypothetical protein